MKKIAFVAVVALTMVAAWKEIRDYQRISNAIDELADACEDSGQQPY